MSFSRLITLDHASIAPLAATVAQFSDTHYMRIPLSPILVGITFPPLWVYSCMRLASYFAMLSSLTKSLSVEIGNPQHSGSMQTYDCDNSFSFLRSYPSLNTYNVLSLRTKLACLRPKKHFVTLSLLDSLPVVLRHVLSVSVFLYKINTQLEELLSLCSWAVCWCDFSMVKNLQIALYNLTIPIWTLVCQYAKRDLTPKQSAI